MATIPILGNPDLGNREQLNTILQKLTADPGSPVEGHMFYRDDTDRVRVRIAGAWKDVAFTSDISGLSNDTVTNAILANMGTGTVKARLTAGTGDPEDVTLAALKTALSIAAGDVSGLGALATLAAVGSAQITDGAIMNVDVNASALIALSKLQTIANNRVVGNVSGGAAVPVELTPAQIRTFLGTLDADTVGGQSASAIVTSAVNAISGGAGAAYDTLIEIQGLLQADDTADALISAAMATKNKLGVAADLGTASADAVHNHALGTRDVLCQLVRKSDWKHVIAPYTITDTDNVTWNLDAAPSAGQYRSIIVPAAA